MIIFNNEKLKEQSLNDLCIELNEHHGIEIRKQSLHERFNKNALKFLKRALERLLNQQISLELSLKDYRVFKRILLKDSVCFQLDPSLADDYPGCGGCSSEAAIRIQFEYDILSGKINDLSINPFNSQDATDSIATLDLTRKGDLIIRDLAYMSLGVLKEIIKKDAYFLCRPSPGVGIYEIQAGVYKKINLVKIKHYMKEHHISILEKEVYVGSEEKLPVRLILNLMPEEEVAIRIRKAEAN